MGRLSLGFLLLCGCRDKVAEAKNAQLQHELLVKSSDLVKAQHDILWLIATNEALRAQLAQVAPDVKRARTLAVTIGSRIGFQGGQVLVLQNNSNNDLAVRVDFTRETGSSKGFETVLGTTLRSEIGVDPGWKAAPGDTAVVSAPNYDPVKFVFQ